MGPTVRAQLLCVAATGLLNMGCRRHIAPPHTPLTRDAGQPAAIALDRASFESTILPILRRVGCGSGDCHGSGLVSMHLSLGTASNFDGPTLFVQVQRRTNAQAPAQSLLLTKALGEDHQGGQGIDRESCESRAILQWIQGGSPAPCPARVDHRTRAGEPLAPLPPELDTTFTQCASSRCHGGTVAPQLVAPTLTAHRAQNAVALFSFTEAYLPSTSRLLKALRGEGAHPAMVHTPDDPVWRQLAGWMSGEPVSQSTQSRWPGFAQTIQPILVRRGCSSSSCHGTRDNFLTILNTPEAIPDNYLRLLSSIDARSFPRKPQNEQAHGGGRRLGGTDDCATRVIQRWISVPGATTFEPCVGMPPPDRERFASIILPALTTLTCPRCHGAGLGGFWLTNVNTGDELERNYQSVVAHVDLDFPPTSRVLARVREDCLQAKFLAWVGRAPDPGCTVSLANFRGSFPVVRDQ